MTTKNRKHRKKNKQARNILKKPKRIAGLKDAHRLACKRSITKRGQERQAFQIGRVGKSLELSDSQVIGKAMAGMTQRNGYKCFKGNPRNKVNGVSLSGFAMPIRRSKKGKPKPMGRGFTPVTDGAEDIVYQVTDNVGDVIATYCIPKYKLEQVQSDDSNSVALRMLQGCAISAKRIEEFVDGLEELSALGKYHKGLKDSKNWTRGKSGGKAFS